MNCELQVAPIHVPTAIEAVLLANDLSLALLVRGGSKA
jgi:hypothetical protein